MATDTTEHASGSIINDATEETANENLNTGYETPENINDNNHNINTDVSELFVDPTEIAENIVTADEIDPNDIDLADNVDIQSIGTVYTITGNTYLAAAFQDVNGNDFLMVDIDGDSVFDRITDMNLQYDFGGVPGGLAVTDAEAMIQEDPTYLAQNEQDESSDFMDEMLEDLVDPTV